MIKKNPFRYFKTSLEVIRMAVMNYVRFPLSLRNVEDMLHERGVEISHELSDFGGIGSVQSLQMRSENAELKLCDQVAGRGTWTKFS